MQQHILGIALTEGKTSERHENFVRIDIEIQRDRRLLSIAEKMLFHVLADLRVSFLDSLRLDAARYKQFLKRQGAHLAANRIR